MQLQKVKDKAIRRRREMLILARSRTNELEDEFHSLKTTSDGSIRLVCFRCWNEFEGATCYMTADGKPSSAFRKKSVMLLNTTKVHEKYLKHWSLQRFKLDPYIYNKLTDCYGGAYDWVTSVGPGDNVAVLYACSGCNNALLKTNGWLKAKTCSSGSYEKTQWHCPHCCLKWRWGASAHDCWIIIYSGCGDLRIEPRSLYLGLQPGRLVRTRLPMASQSAIVKGARGYAARDQPRECDQGT
eukprot:6490278-Amphidinium_carterae.1